MKSKDKATSVKVKFHTRPVTIRERMENARSMELFNSNYEDDIFDHLNNNSSKKVVNHFKLDVSSSSVDTLEESDASSKSFSSPFVVPPPLSSSSQSETPVKYRYPGKKPNSPIKSFSHWAFVNKRLKDRSKAKVRSKSLLEENVPKNLKTGDKLHEVLKKSFEYIANLKNDDGEDVEEYFTEDDDEN